MPALGFPAWLSMDVQINYYSASREPVRPRPRGGHKLIRLGRSSSGLQQGGATIRVQAAHRLLNATIDFIWRRSGKLLGTRAPHHSRAPRRRLRQPAALQRGHLQDPLSGARQRPPAREQPRIVGDHAGHAERLEAADPRQLVDRPDVELAAGAADGPDQRAGSTSRQWAMIASHRPAAERPGRPGGQQPRASASTTAVRGHRISGCAERVATQLGHRPAQPHAGLGGADQRPGSRGYWLEISARSSRPCSRSASSTSQLVAGELEVDVELDAVEGARRRGGRGPRRACQRPRASSVARSRGRGTAARAVRRVGQDVELDHVDARRRSAASKLAERVAGRDQVGALVADSRSALIAGIAGAPDRSVRLSSPCRAARIGVPQRGQGRPACRRLASACLRAVRCRDSACAAAAPSTIATASCVGDLRDRPPRVDPRCKAGFGPPDVAEARRRCAGRAARRRSAVSGRPAAQPARKRSLVEGRRREDVGAECRRAADRSACAPRSSAPARARRTGPPRDPAARTPARRDGRRGASAARLVDPPRPRHAQVRVQGQLTLEAEEQVLAVGAPRRRHRLAGQALGPAIRPCRGCGVRISSGRGPRARGGSGWPHSGWCRLRAWLGSRTVG